MSAPFCICQCALEVYAARQIAAVSFGCLKIAKYYHQEVIKVVGDPAAELPYGFKLWEASNCC